MLMRTKSMIEAFPLNQVPVDNWVSIVGITGNKRQIKRLITLGMMEDTQLKVIQSQRGNGLVVICGEARLAIGTEMARHIMVVPLSDQVG